MRPLVLAVLLCAISCMFPAAAWEPHTYESEVQDSVSTHAYQEIADLNPSGALLPTGAMRDCVSTYRNEPSFRPNAEWCVAHVEGHWLIRSAGSLRSNDTNAVNVNAKQTEKRISEATALLIHEIWLNAILEARYSRMMLLGADGETHYFGARRHWSAALLQAEVWSPHHENPPLWLATAGMSIFRFAQTEANDSASLEKDLIALRSKLFNFYRARNRD